MEREPLRWQTHLGQWVADLTPSRVALELRGAGLPVTESAVYKWVAGQHAPRPDIALRIVEISGGRLSVADVYLQRAEVAGLQHRTGGHVQQQGLA